MGASWVLPSVTSSLDHPMTCIDVIWTEDHAIIKFMTIRGFHQIMVTLSKGYYCFSYLYGVATKRDMLLYGTSIIKTWLCNFWYINQVADFSNRFWPIYPMCEVIANLFFGKNFSDIQCIKTKLNLLCVAFEVQNMYASFWKIHLKFRPQTSKTNYASDMVIRF